MKEVKEKKAFAQGYCFIKIFLFFVIGCILGAYYEEIGFIIRHGYWAPRRALLYGPFSPVYGIAFMLVAIVFGKKTDMKWTKAYIYCFFLGGLLEYSLSWIQQLIFHSRSWNYDGYFLNIGGRTTVIFMFAWGLMGMIFIKILYPLISNLIEKIPYKIGNICFIILLIFMIFDISVSLAATLRQTNRRKGNPPITFIGKLCDEIYPDDVLKKVYNNAVYE